MAQQVSAPAGHEVIVTDPHLIIPIKETGYLVDSLGTLTFDEVSSEKYAHKFSYEGIKRYNYNNESGVWFWIRIGITNKTNKELMLLIPAQRLREMIWYSNGPDGITEKHFNVSSLRTSPVFSMDHSIELNIPKDSTAVLYFKHNQFTADLKASIGSSDAVFERQEQLQYLFGFFHGVYLLIVIFVLLIWLNSKETVHFKYLVWVITFSFYILDQSRVTSYFIPAYIHQHIALDFFSISISTMAFLGFARDLFDVNLENRFKRLLYFIFYIFLIVTLVNSLLRYHYILNVQALRFMVLVINATITIEAWRSYRSGSVHALYSFFGLVFLLITVLLYVLNLLNLLHFGIYDTFILEIGSVVYTLMFTYGVTRKIRDEGIHYKNLLVEQNALLEQKVLERTSQLEGEKQKSDNLLLNILPEEIAQELKEFGKSKARMYNEVSVLFTDFVNFTGISEKLSPEELVNEIDHCFKHFDDIIEKHGLEKIKTIGDAYLAVCGLPNENPEHAERTVEAALELLDFVNKRRNDFGLFEIRIGVHSGSVIAGIVGIKKFAYDIWGDTVNLASRMESSSEPGKVNISGATYEKVKDKFVCEYRGMIKAKNKGELEMYFVNGILN
jgi:adenylate cyclase